MESNVKIAAPYEFVEFDYVKKLTKEMVAKKCIGAHTVKFIQCGSEEWREIFNHLKCVHSLVLSASIEEKHYGDLAQVKSLTHLNLSTNSPSSGHSSLKEVPPLTQLTVL
jgi:hypothetical protein